LIEWIPGEEEEVGEVEAGMGREGGWKEGVRRTFREHRREGRG
jgi:hypothetical protein